MKKISKQKSLPSVNDLKTNQKILLKNLKLNIVSTMKII